MTARAGFVVSIYCVVFDRGIRTVDVQAAVTNNLLDLTVGLEVLKALAGKGAVDLEAIDEGGNGDQTVGLNILVELLGSGLVEGDGVLGLVLDYIEKAS